MSIINSIWVRGLTGIGTAGLIIVGATVLFPMTGTNLAGHILGWIMAGFAGIKITLSAFEDEETWMEAGLEAEVEADVKSATIAGSVENETVKLARFEPVNRLSWKPKEETVLEYPANLDRGRQIVVSKAFHKPEDEEKEVCIRFAAENPICSLATVDDQNAGQPHVRTVFLWRADESGFYFVLFSSKEVSRQVKAHPNVELCFQNHPKDILEAKQLRVHGRMDLLKNRRLTEEASRDRSILNTLAGEGKDADIEVYHLSDFEMKFWQMGTVAKQTSAQVAIS